MSDIFTRLEILHFLIYPLNTENKLALRKNDPKSFSNYLEWQQSQLASFLRSSFISKTDGTMVYPETWLCNMVASSDGSLDRSLERQVQRQWNEVNRQKGRPKLRYQLSATRSLADGWHRTKNSAEQICLQRKLNPNQTALVD